MEVGQKIYLKPIGNQARYSQEIKEVRVGKVGRKYFELEDKHYGRFFIETMNQDCGQYISGYTCYLSMQEIEDEKQAIELLTEIKKVFSGFSTDLPLSKLKEIHRIINCA